MNLVRQGNCYLDWQQAWSTVPSMFIEHTSGTYQMLVMVYYQGVTRTAVFKDVRYTRTYLTVGAYVSGDAGNGWGAPFVSRTVQTYTESNLQPFFYASGSVSAGGVESYEEQVNRNATTITRGFYWYHSDAAIFNTPIHAINLWIKP